MSLASIKGQARAVRLLKPLLESGRLPPALVFYGPEGVGKAALAVELAKALNCLRNSCPAGQGARGAAGSGTLPAAPAGQGARGAAGSGTVPAADACDACDSCAAGNKGIDPDLKRVNAAYQAGLREEEADKQRTLRVDTIRHLIKDVEMTSLAGRWKTAIVEDAERIEIEAANALLKSLEEPPARTLWILVTSRRERLLPTILSRCHRVPFAPLPEREVAAILAGRGLPPSEAARLARLSDGSPGRALSLRALDVPEPEEWEGDPLSPFKLADALPKELHRARPLVEAHLRRIAWRLRDKDRRGVPTARSGLREIAKLNTALRSNADPRLVLQLAALELERAR